MPARISCEMKGICDEAEFGAFIEEQVRAVMQSVYNLQPAWCLFEGVRCGNSPGNANHANVNSISLPHLGLSGTLPDSIGSFRCLTHFDVSHNHLRGTIPATVSNWHSGVRELLMSNNMFTGSIPHSIGACRALVVLTLDSNKLTGTVPSSIRGMTSLARLDVDRNSLTSTIPMHISESTHPNSLTTVSADIVHECTFSEETDDGALLLHHNSALGESILCPKSESSAARRSTENAMPTSE